MKFPERVLRVKADNPEDAQNWLAAIDKAYKARLQGQQQNKEKKLEALRKVRRWDVPPAGIRKGISDHIHQYDPMHGRVGQPCC